MKSRSKGLSGLGAILLMTCCVAAMCSIPGRSSSDSAISNSTSLLHPTRTSTAVSKPAATRTPAPTRFPKNEVNQVLSQPDAGDTRMVTASFLNVREGPGSDYAVVGGLAMCDRVTVSEPSGAWLKVRTATDEGYVSSQFLGPVGPCSTSEPIQANSVTDSGSGQASGPTPDPRAGCDPSYPGVCIPLGSADYDCASGSGNGPNYIYGPLQVVPPDPHDLDRDGDGVGCES